MAWFEIDIYRKCVEVDLHDYSHRFAGGSLLIALRPNPAPVDGEWKEMPVFEYR